MNIEQLKDFVDARRGDLSQAQEAVIDAMVACIEHNIDVMPPSINEVLEDLSDDITATNERIADLQTEFMNHSHTDDGDDDTVDGGDDDTVDGGDDTVDGGDDDTVDGGDDDTVDGGDDTVDGGDDTSTGGGNGGTTVPPLTGLPSNTRATVDLVKYPTHKRPDEPQFDGPIRTIHNRSELSDLFKRDAINNGDILELVGEDYGGGDLGTTKHVWVRPQGWPNHHHRPRFAGGGSKGKFFQKDATPMHHWLRVDGLLGEDIDSPGSNSNMAFLRIVANVWMQDCITRRARQGILTNGGLDPTYGVVVIDSTFHDVGNKGFAHGIYTHHPRFWGDGLDMQSGLGWSRQGTGHHLKITGIESTVLNSIIGNKESLMSMPVDVSGKGGAHYRKNCLVRKGPSGNGRVLLFAGGRYGLTDLRPHYYHNYDCVFENYRSGRGKEVLAHNENKGVVTVNLVNGQPVEELVECFGGRVANFSPEPFTLGKAKVHGTDLVNVS